MRKILSIILTFCLLFSFAIPISARPLHKDYIKVKVDGEYIDCGNAKPYIAEGERTMLPIRFISEALNLNVSWNSSKRQVTIKGTDIKLIMKIGSINAALNDQKITLEVPPVILNGRTMVPLRFIAETYGCLVSWDESNLTVNITTPFYYQKGYYYFNDFKIEVKGGDELTNAEHTYTVTRKDNLFEIKEHRNCPILLELVLKRDVDANKYNEQLTEFKEILLLNEFSKEDTEYLLGEMSSLLTEHGTVNKGYASKGNTIIVQAEYNKNVHIYFTSEIPN